MSSRSNVCAGLVALALAAACGGGPGSGSPQSESSLLTAGLNAQTHGDNATASSDYKKVLALDPSNKYALYNLGLIAQEGGDAAGAERYYRAALNVDPSFGDALFNLAIVRTKADPAEAEDLYRRAISTRANWAEAHLNLGFLLISEGKAAEGRAELATAVQLEPGLASRIPPGVLAPTPTPTP